jgi:hypothetical protein
MEQRQISRTREGVVTVVAVLLCLASFFAVIHFSFPEGMELRGLIQASGLSPWDDVDGAPSLDPAGLSRRKDRLATLVSVTRTVKNKPADAIAWNDAKEGLDLGNRHSVQTLGGASATIQFDGSGSLILGENSLIVLQSYDGELDGSDREATLLVFGGELRAQIMPGPPGVGVADSGPLNLRIRTPSGETIIRAQEGSSQATDVRVKVATDSSATITVVEGTAEVTVDERTVEVSPGEVVDVVPGVELTEARMLPGVPTATVPKDGASFRFRTRAPDIQFGWEPAPFSDRTLLVVARDRGLKNVVLREEIGGGSFVAENLEGGDYFWSVQGLQEEVPGKFSSVRSLRLVMDDQGPALDVGWPDGEVSRKTLRLSGFTEPGAQVFVGSSPAATKETGQFEIELELVPGANSIVVESIDPVDNSSYETRIIKARY